ncbi:hypothetical protein ACFSKR_01180 [Kitasatospora cinereorecta]
MHTMILLGLCTAVALWMRDVVETDNYTLEAGLESLAAGLTAVLFRRGVRTWERKRPLPGEIWLARVPFRDRDEAAPHYCVVVGRRFGHADVLQITSQNKDTRDDFVRIPNVGWDTVSGKDHWLEIGLTPRRVPYVDFLKSRPQGACPRTTWRQIRDRRRKCRAAAPRAREPDRGPPARSEARHLAVLARHENGSRVSPNSTARCGGSQPGTAPAWTKGWTVSP